MCEKEDFNLKGAPSFKVYTDAKNMYQFLHRNLQQVKNLRIFKMLERLLPYDIIAEYKPDTKMAVADNRSRSPISE